MYYIHNTYIAHTSCMCKNLAISVLRILFEHLALNHVISHLCQQSSANYDCAGITCKPDNPLTDYLEYRLYA